MSKITKAELQEDLFRAQEQITRFKKKEKEDSEEFYTRAIKAERSLSHLRDETSQAEYRATQALAELSEAKGREELYIKHLVETTQLLREAILALIKRNFPNV